MWLELIIIVSVETILLQRYHESSFNCSQLSCSGQSGSGLSLGNPNGNPLDNDHQVLLLQNVMCLFILAADQVDINLQEFREIRAEQNHAYEESLSIDRQKVVSYMFC